MSAWWLAWQEGFAGFAWPWAWAALPLPLLAWLLLPPRQSSAAALRVPWRRRLDQVAAGGDAGVRGAWLLPLLAWVLLCAATARPQQLGPAQVPPREARQMMLAVDLSGSMSEADMELGGRVVDRLTAAKAVIADFLDRRAGDREHALAHREVEGIADVHPRRRRRAGGEGHHHSDGDQGGHRPQHPAVRRPPPDPDRRAVAPREGVGLLGAMDVTHGASPRAQRPVSSRCPRHA